MAVKVTFTLDESTITRLGDNERTRQLRVLGEWMAQMPTKPHSDVEHELRDIRKSRRSSGRRAAIERRS